jgi:hypothetical protein
METTARNAYRRSKGDYSTTVTPSEILTAMMDTMFTFLIPLQQGARKVEKGMYEDGNDKRALSDRIVCIWRL